jgi:hypothetical protein
MNLGQIRLYGLFRRELSLPDDKAADFVVALGEVCEWQVDGKKELFAKQADMNLVKSDINTLKGDVSILKSDVGILKSDVSSLKSGLHSLDIKMERYKGETIKAIYWVGLAQFITILGGLIAILKFLR